MGVIGGRLGVSLLNWASRNSPIGFPDVATAYLHKSKLEVLLGESIWNEIQNKEVLDFGCGPGLEAVEMAERGAARVIGLDLNQQWLTLANKRAEEHGVTDRVVFATHWTEPVDVVISLDSFEHFADCGEILKIMATLLKPGGCVFASFGPTWYHPLGGHLYSVFPFAHLVFSEPALMAWRALHKPDKPKTIAESGLNQMTLRRFERIVAASPFRFETYQPVPIRRLAWMHNRWTREFTTATVRCKLVRR